VGHSEGKRRGERRIDYGRSDGTVTRGPDLRPHESRPAAAYVDLSEETGWRGSDV
jgi:hypothetical protein